MDKGKAIIDGDIIAYRAAFSSQELGSSDAERKVDDLMSYILDEVVGYFAGPEDYVVYITGKTNFRFEVAKSHPYKGNRKDVEKPRHLSHVRDYLTTKYGAVMSEGEEADDLIAMEAARLGYNACVASIDKDMLQIPCWHFNIVKGTMTKVTPEEGMRFFYTQMLTGDKADNIIGLHRVGPVKAEKILGDASDEEELWDRALKAYDGDVDRVLENARLLWLRREKEEMWLPPKARYDSKQ